MCSNTYCTLFEWLLCIVIYIQKTIVKQMITYLLVLYIKMMWKLQTYWENWESTRRKWVHIYNKDEMELNYIEIRHFSLKYPKWENTIMNWDKLYCLRTNIFQWIRAAVVDFVIKLHHLVLSGSNRLLLLTHVSSSTSVCASGNQLACKQFISTGNCRRETSLHNSIFARTLITTSSSKLARCAVMATQEKNRIWELFSELNVNEATVCDTKL